jgi:hypothetical protein
VAYPSHVARSALRRALREHFHAATFLTGRKINDLTLAELTSALIALGLDPDAIAAAALNTPAPQQLVELPCDNLPQNETETAVAELPCLASIWLLNRLGSPSVHGKTSPTSDSFHRTGGLRSASLAGMGDPSRLLGCLPQRKHHD